MAEQAADPIEAACAAQYNETALRFGDCSLSWGQISADARTAWRREFEAALKAFLTAAEQQGWRLVQTYPDDLSWRAFGMNADKFWDDHMIWSGDFGNFAASWLDALEAAPRHPIMREGRADG